MKFFFPLIILFATVSCNNSTMKCDDEKCAQNKRAGTLQASADSGGDKNPVIACKLTAPELRKRKEEVISVLKNKQLEKKELKDGYSFRFKGDNETLDLLNDFVKSERECCDFFSFSIHVQNTETIWFDITGPAEAKEFIEAELGM
jgi:hypothetical protein